MKSKVSGTALAVVLIAIAALTACGGQQGEPATSNMPTTESETSNVVEIVTRNMAYIAPDTIASGWTTIRMINDDAVAHFGLLDKLPEGYGVEDMAEEVAPVFVEGAELLYDGETDAAMEVFGRLPEWFQEVSYVGGPGFLSPGQSTEVVVHLQPGTYVLECYVKTNGAFHPMQHEITVTEDDTGALEPVATSEITVSSERGIEADSVLVPGPHTVAVHFADQATYEHFLGHDVHLAAIEDDTDVDALAAWMDWSEREGLETPSPAVFLGGTQDAQADQTVYLNIDLEPGTYVWIAEVPDPGGKGMLVPINVDNDQPES